MARKRTITDDEQALLVALYAFGYPAPEAEVDGRASTINYAAGGRRTSERVSERG